MGLGWCKHSLRSVWRRVSFALMTTLSSIVKELEALPPEKLEEAASFIHALNEGSRQRKREILERTFGKADPEETERIANVIEEGCEQIDVGDWR